MMVEKKCIEIVLEAVTTLTAFRLMEIGSALPTDQTK